MSNRFSNLNSNTNHNRQGRDSNGNRNGNRNENENGNGNGNTVRDMDRQNIFRQKSKYPRPSYLNRSKNRFKSTPEPTVVFNLEEINFPNLTTNIPQINMPTISYSEKIIDKVEDTQEVSTLPPGFMVLTHEKLRRKTSQNQESKEPLNEYYNPAGARLIMENRIKQRKELNDILGDLSPYWDLPLEIEDNDEEDMQDFDQDSYSEEDDYEYCQDW
jgi:hypothetical protein